MFEKKIFIDTSWKETDNHIAYDRDKIEKLHLMLGSNILAEKIT